MMTGRSKMQHIAADDAASTHVVGMTVCTGTYQPSRKERAARCGRPASRVFVRRKSMSTTKRSRAELQASTALSSTESDGATPNARDNVAQFPGPEEEKSHVSSEDRAALDEAEKLAEDALLDEDEGDSPSESSEIVKPLVVKKLPRFANFRASPQTFELWGTVDQQGMEESVITTTRSFAPQFEDDVELRRIRFYETVTTDGVVRLIWCPLPEKNERNPNAWITTKIEAMDHAQVQWTTMRSRPKLGQWTYRPSTKQDKEYGKPKFSGRTKAQWLLELKKLGLLVQDKDHAFYQKATDTE
jgi:hypothetical protein